MDKQTSDVMFSSDSVEYGTPDWVFDPLNDRFKFTLDAAASHENHKVPVYFTPEGRFVKHFSTPNRLGELDGLRSPWNINFGSHRVWLNPPYGRGIEAWVHKCAQEAPRCAVIVALLPARTDTDWFHRWVFPYADLHFLQGRIKFIGGESSAPFPSVIAVYRPEQVRGGRVIAYADDLHTGDASKW